MAEAVAEVVVSAGVLPSYLSLTLDMCLLLPPPPFNFFFLSIVVLSPSPPAPARGLKGAPEYIY